MNLSPWEWQDFLSTKQVLGGVKNSKNVWHVIKSDKLTNCWHFKIISHIIIVDAHVDEWSNARLFRHRLNFQSNSTDKQKWSDVRKTFHNYLFVTVSRDLYSSLVVKHLFPFSSFALFFSFCSSELWESNGWMKALCTCEYSNDSYDWGDSLQVWWF